MIEVRAADVTALPFDSATFDVVVSQHVQMNIADKRRLYAEARRVLTPGGRLALWDVTAGSAGPLHVPVLGPARSSRAISSAPSGSPSYSERPGLRLRIGTTSPSQPGR